MVSRSVILMLLLLVAKAVSAGGHETGDELSGEGFYVLQDRDAKELSMDNVDVEQIETIRVTKNVWLLQGVISNTALCIGDDSVVMIDPGMPEVSDALLASVRGITDKPVRLVINTHWHWDHAGANARMAEQGATIVAQERALQWMTTWQISGRAGTPKAPQPEQGLPTITFGDRMSIRIPGCPLTLIGPVAAHTDGDAIVYFSTADIWVLGDIFLNGTFPYFDVNTGGNINGVIAALDEVLARIEPTTIVIPGHGVLSNGAEMKEFRDMVATVRDRVQSAMDAGKTREEILEMGLTADLDARWGNPFVKGPFLVTIAHASLQD